MAQWWLVRDVARTTMGTSREGGVAAQTVRLRLRDTADGEGKVGGKRVCARARVFLRKKEKKYAGQSFVVNSKNCNFTDYCWR